MLEQLVRFSIERRHLVLSSVLLLLLSGIWSYQHLPLDAVPDITNVQVQINTEAPGYSPLEVEQRITWPVENALYGLPALNHTRSLSRYGLSQVTVVFDEGTDIYFARNQVNERLAEIRALLPPNINTSMGPLATGLGEVLAYTVDAKPGARKADGSPVTLTDLREVQDWIIRPQLAQVRGVAEINTIGGYAKQFHVTPDPRRLLEYGITMASLVQALQASNVNLGAGFIEKNGQQLLVRSPGQLTSPDDIADLVVGQHGRATVRVRDLATVAVGHELRTGTATLDGDETVLGSVMMRMGENSRTVAESAAARLANIQTSLPEWAGIRVVYSRTTLVNQTIQTVQKNLVEGALLVIAVLFLLLGNLRAALITAAVIPLAMLATLTGMVERGVSANLMSLGALDFGLLVDGAVIIVENCVRRLGEAQQQQGTALPHNERLETVRHATLEVIRPSLFGLLIITLVYLPLLTLSGVEGKMFEPMALTVMMALTAAMALSLTLIPAAVATFLTGEIREKHSRFMRWVERRYLPALKFSLTQRRGLLVVSALLVLACTGLATRLGSEFVPQLDEGDIALHAIRINGTGIDQSTAMQRVVEQELLKFPEVAHVYSKTGTGEVATDPMPANVSDTFVMLKPRHAWPNPRKLKTELIDEIEAGVEALPGNSYEFTQPIQMRFNELLSGVRADVAIKLFGDDLDTLKRSADAIVKVTAGLRGSTDARVEPVAGLPMLEVIPDRVRLARYHLTLEDLQDTLSTGVGGREAGLIHQGDRRFPLVVRLPESLRTDLAELAALPLLSPTGQAVPLSEVAQLETRLAPAQISRENGKRVVVVTTNVRERDLGSFVTELRQTLAQADKVPAGYWLDYGGTFEQLESASQRLAIIVPLTLLGIFGLLIWALGSVKDALIVFVCVPLALTGGVLALWLRGIPFSISAAVGLIALSGVAVLNGLVMLAFIRHLWQQNNDLLQAVLEGARTRLRPVLMTALVASLGFVPMALNTGIGAEVQRPLATVVIGGILSSTLLTLLVLPALYHWLHSRDTLTRPSR